MPLDLKLPNIVAERVRKRCVTGCLVKNINQITVLGCANVDGQSQPPFVTFNAK